MRVGRYTDSCWRIVNTLVPEVDDRLCNDYKAGLYKVLQLLKKEAAKEEPVKQSAAEGDEWNDISYQALMNNQQIDFLQGDPEK